MMINLIDIGIEGLIESGDEKYIARSKRGHELKNMVVPGLIEISEDKENRSYAALVQGLFESGFLKPTESCFNLDQMWSYIYGYKMRSSVDTFFKLFDELKSGGFISKNKSYNSSGDNYYWVLEYRVLPDEDDIKVRRIVDKMFGDVESDPWPDDIFRKVIVMEKQSPLYAVVMDYSILSKEPSKMHFVRLKHDYSDPCVMGELNECEFKMDVNNKYSAFGDHKKICKVVATLDFATMECKPVIEPKTIESVLFNIYSGLDSMNDE